MKRLESKRFNWQIALLLFGLLSGCSGAPAATPLPPSYLPTAVALTLAARPSSTALKADTHPATTSVPVIPTAATNPQLPTPLPEDIPSPAPIIPSVMPAIASTQAITNVAIPSNNEVQEGNAITLTLPEQPTPTPPPGIPEGAIRIYRLGELSKILSPLKIRTYIAPGSVGPLQVSLLGEDGRVLMRQVKNMDPKPLAWADLSFALNYEISAAAEVGHLVVRTDDAYGRPLAINSVNLILLAMGETELNPGDAWYQRIVIQQPTDKSLIQGGKVVVSGLARKGNDQPLRVQLVAENGAVVGQRLAAVDAVPGGNYGTFAVEVPYTVIAVTPVRLEVFEPGQPIPEIAYLASQELMISP
jgi:hypothetical protein